MMETAGDWRRGDAMKDSRVCKSRYYICDQCQKQFLPQCM